ncbi:MAG TPA: efflux RND transporter periplasmic adaptor subunit [Candidatus Agrococcus pullicola]|uniref:Efflux RND transporter periplasmic adaptor subunit n=1 Tax=Candidatus Agrococcus pullicola TaxID=2838429 RepID=A0A9D1YVT2_9MICO|nr:efflux RND transporter periplasmic adaptor subunit [Candidatus Agrococcus pullicola]
MVAPASGTLVEFPFMVGMPVDIGLETGAIQPSAFHVEAPITAAEQYRLTEEPDSASVTIADGPAPFDCEDVRVVQSETASPAAEGEDASTATIQCPVPQDVRVFPGLAIELTVAGGSAEGVPVLPATAVIGTADTGIVYVPGSDGRSQEVEIGIGVNDGQTVEITSGLEVGDEVLQYAPGSDDVDCADPEFYDPLFCEEGP